MSDASDNDKHNQPAQKPLAIVGIGSMFPKARDLERFWSNIKHGVDAITEVPDTHWSPEDYFDEDQKRPDFTYGRRGGFLDPYPFNPMKYGIPPTSIEATDTSQLLGMVVAESAMEDAGYGMDRDFDRSKVSVILGVTGALEMVIPLGARLGHPQWRKALKEAGCDQATIDDAIQRMSDSYVDWQENSFPGLLGNVVAGRISKYLNTGGTNCVVDAACASSLSALHLAALELNAGKADMVVTGGADTFNDIFMYMCFSKTPALSPTGNSKPFANDCDGTILGEGLGMVVMKRLEDAERDGDTIYALVKGVGSSSDGKGDAIYAPSSPGQKKALEAAYQAAGVTPDTIELLEAHGTGTMKGDEVEAAALTQVYKTDEDSKRSSWVALGSVKSQIGHTKSSAGAAGLIKAALALHHKVLPPTIKVDQPADSVAPGTTPFYVNTTQRPWVSNPAHPRRAAVSAFGFGGSNFHMVMEEYQPKKSAADWDGLTQIIAYSGDSIADIQKQLGALDNSANWDAVRAHAKQSRVDFDAAKTSRLVLVLEESKYDIEKIKASVASNIEKHGDSESWSSPDGAYYGHGAPSGKLAYIFPGQGAQYTGMLRDLACEFPEMIDALNLANDEFGTNEAGQRLSDRIYPHPTFDKESADRDTSELTNTDVAQPAIGTISLGAANILNRFGVEPQAVAGHSYGELVALCAAGVLTPEGLVQASKLRGELMGQGEGDRGTMLAVRGNIEATQAVIDSEKLDVIIANKNSPKQAVLSGSIEAVKHAREVLDEKKIKSVPLTVAAAFHSHLVADAAIPFAKGLGDIKFAKAAIPVYSNTTGTAYPKKAKEVRELLANQLAKPVEWVNQITAMHEAGVTTFIEVGPGARMTGLVKAILKGKEFDVYALDASSGTKSGIADLAKTLARTVALGHHVELTAWDDAYEIPEVDASKKPRMLVEICGANYRSEQSQKKMNRPATPPRIIAPPAVTPSPRAVAPTRSEVATTPAPTIQAPMQPAPQAISTTPADAGAVANLLQQTQANIAALQQMQQQTAQLHAQFLQGQEQASKTFSTLMQQQQQLFQQTGFVSAPAPVASMPSPIQSQAPAPNASAPMATTSAPAVEAALPTPAPTAAPANLLMKTLLAVVAEKTGYPDDMLELEMSLDADLGIDSIKRVEILSALQEQIPELPTIEADELGAIETLQDIVDKLGTSVSSESLAASPVATQASQDQLKAVLLDVVSEKTGYPVDMLDLDMSLDADLGIDSIKRVEILSTLQEAMPELPTVEAEALGALETLQDVINYLNDYAPAPSAAKAPASIPGATLQRILLEIVSEKTGYPVDMLDLDMSMDADLGIDSIKRVEILSALQEAE
ncbi:MAG TPA: acyltransferase domain-containing protein, partial [Candidatus Hydrogenedentes bacterium]|nr:acyltransferase domain-containing protein [Candidatus Hydrogenedentota bacterium]